MLDGEGVIVPNKPPKLLHCQLQVEAIGVIEFMRDARYDTVMEKLSGC
jgi:hypothetical protein